MNTSIDSKSKTLSLQEYNKDYCAKATDGNFMLLNIQSINSNFDLFHNLLTQLDDVTNFSFIGLTECWLRAFNINFNIAGFTAITSKEFYNRASGTILYLNQSVKFEQLHVFNSLALTTSL